MKNSKVEIKKPKRLLLLALVFLILNFKFSFACDCGEQLPEFSKEETEKYGLIFIGTVDSIQPGERNGLAWFHGKELYKGLATPVIAIQFDNYTSCRVPFEAGETWMIYAVKDSVNSRWTVTYCSRSRKYPSQGEVDEYTVYSNLTFEEERKFLTAIYPPKDFIPQNTIDDISENNKTVIDSNRNLMHADNRQKLLLIAASVIGMVLIYLVVKKWLK